VRPSNERTHSRRANDKKKRNKEENTQRMSLTRRYTQSPKIPENLSHRSDQARLHLDLYLRRRQSHLKITEKTGMTSIAIKF